LTDERPFGNAQGLDPLDDLLAEFASWPVFPARADRDIEASHDPQDKAIVSI
jgi:hypothetical protein